MTGKRKTKGGPTNQSQAGRALAEQRGPDYMKALATKGGKAAAKKLGPDFYREISRKGVARRQKIYDAGRRALGES